MNSLSLIWRWQAKYEQIRRSASPRPASESGATECQRSGVCCWRRPCELFPGDVERIADHLEVTPRDVFAQFLVVDEVDGRLMLVPRRGEQDGGVYLRAEQTYDISTPCIFLDVENGNACKVHAAKPTGGALWTCSMSAAEMAAIPRPAWTREQLIELGWDGDRDR